MPILSKDALKRRFTTVFELPRDIMLDLPTMNLIGDEEFTLFGHKGIGEYSPTQIRIKTAIGNIRITGEALTLKEINKESITATGKITQILLD